MPFPTIVACVFPLHVNGTGAVPHAVTRIPRIPLGGVVTEAEGGDAASGGTEVLKL